MSGSTHSPAGVQEALGSPQGREPHPGMVWTPGGTLHMVSEDFYPEQAPVHPVTVDGFWSASILN